MNKPNKKIGVITAVDSDVSQVGVYEMSNDANFLWYGDILTGPKLGAYLTINQNDVKIIATVSTEKIIDQQNSISSQEFDNRYRKSSINRVITLKTKGVIKNNKFQVTSQYVPMIGNEVTLTSIEELNVIYGVEDSNLAIRIGKTILENQTVNLPIDKFFASHIGIFGNTGSGKSNTLHKLYLELFDSKFGDNIIQKSQFFVIDFNGEYAGTDMFKVNEDNKFIFNINTRTRESDKIPVTEDYLFDADILSILFDARPATQVPFLRNAVKNFNSKKDGGMGSFVVGTLNKILNTGKDVNSDSLLNWIEVASSCLGDDSERLLQVKEIKYHSKHQTFFNKADYSNGSETDNELLKKLDTSSLATELEEYFANNNIDPLKKLQHGLMFAKVHKTAWGKINQEFLNPLFNRIDSSLKSLSKVVDVRPNIDSEYRPLNIISLVNANSEIKRLIPMLLSKMIYDKQKNYVSSLNNENIDYTKHLIIDEAHNILNAQYQNNGDSWQDYRLSVFEEIIKEGRKFGFYLTLASQRPADISPTILSQTHNYLIHRLVNDKDLKMLENTMPTLDRSSYQMIPSLGQGEAIVTGNAMQVPVFVKIDKEESIRPSSDDIKLTELWK
ncbi:ATP-binding protein [Holzapfeliella sp. JNUCC 72]